MNDFLTCVIFCCQNQPFPAETDAHVGLMSGSILFLWPFSMLCPVFRCVIFDAPVLNGNFRCESLCFMLFIHSVSTKSLYILLGEVSHFHCFVV